MRDLNAWFDKGMSKYQYLSSMKVNQNHMLSIYNSFSLPEEDAAVLHALQEKKLRAIVLTADWCGDAMVNIPIFMKMADEAFLEASYLIRDENLELMDQYLTGGRARSIPIFIVIDPEGKESMKWGPRAAKVEELVSELKKDLPQKDDPGYSDAFHNFIGKMTSMYTTDEKIWNIIKDDFLHSFKQLQS
ncbi:thioredoxin family protein [Bacillus lacus]|uniref:Thioredoxin family protein n=1 Tax=Metabacillus lacus TaxID=1983721 RepID=A0A7X2M078_9BACI|nr:thioredoxin family protein [Metabacillus lacus]MRX74301.1 thioredoxin family protein [Metabacillus lacus]